jgi:hypothetical protein
MENKPFLPKRAHTGMSSLRDFTLTRRDAISVIPLIYHHLIIKINLQSNINYIINKEKNG